MASLKHHTDAARFVADWKDRGDEKQKTSLFWIALLQKVYGVEEPVKLDHTSFIDGYIESTHVLIEQKSRDIDLRKGYLQSDGSILTPYGQARKYAGYSRCLQQPAEAVCACLYLHRSGRFGLP